jgi:hypothetical protein
MHLRLGLITAGAAIAAAVFLSAFYATGFALETDPASVIRGSLGVPIEDLDPGNRLGALCFLLNGAALLFFAAMVLFLGRNKFSGKKIAPRWLRAGYPGLVHDGDGEPSGHPERSPGAG